MASVRASALLEYSEVVEQRGADARAFLRGMRMEADSAGVYERKLLYADVARLFQRTAIALEMPSFGIELARRQGTRLLGPLRHLAQTAGTAGDGIRAVLEYLSLYSPAIRFSLQEEGPQAWLTFETRLPVELGLTQIVEKSLLHGCRLLAELTDDACRPRAILLRHAAASPRGLYHRYFGCSVHFSQNANAIALDAADLQRPCVRADADLHAIVRYYLDAQLGNGIDLRGQLRQQMRALLPQQRCQLGRVAQSLGLSARTLQRRLEQAGIDFKQELEQLRRTRAEYLLRETSLSVADVAQALGYRCVTSFCRAHHRWHGVPPLAQRRDTQGTEPVP